MGFPKIVHRKGRHCASSGIRDLVEHHGLKWSEALCFGLGAGLGIWYLNMPELGASRVVHVRSLDLEFQFFTRLGMDFFWEQYPDPDLAERALFRTLDKGLPAIIQTDIFHLPYYNTNTHFPGHVVVAWGYDATRKVFFITDTEREEVLEVPFADLAKARFCGKEPMRIQGNLFAPETIHEPGNLPLLAAEAVQANSRALLDAGFEAAGLAGLRQWLGEIMDWAKLKDWKWAARFTYQVIEKRGTGGGGFRLLYADFLKQAQQIVPDIRKKNLAVKMEELGHAWSAVALALKAASERKKPDFAEAGEKLARLVAMETDFHEEASRIQLP